MLLTQTMWCGVVGIKEEKRELLPADIADWKWHQTSFTSHSKCSKGLFNGLYGDHWLGMNRHRVCIEKKYFYLYLEQDHFDISASGLFSWLALFSKTSCAILIWGNWTRSVWRHEYNFFSSQTLRHFTFTTRKENLICLGNVHFGKIIVSRERDKSLQMLFCVFPQYVTDMGRWHW